MGKQEALELRRSLLDWRERWTRNITEQLEREAPQLQATLDEEINKLGFLDALSPNRFARKKLRPQFDDWREAKAAQLTADAQADLLAICAGTIEKQHHTDSLNNYSNRKTLVDFATAAFSSGAMVAAIPAAASFALVSVPVGGILGVLGFTTTVFVTRNIVVGAFFVLLLLSVALLRWGKVKANARFRLHTATRTQVEKKILYGKQRSSLKLSLIKMIETTANRLIKDIRRA